MEVLHLRVTLNIVMTHRVQNPFATSPERVHGDVWPVSDRLRTEPKVV